VTYLAASYPEIGEKAVRRVHLDVLMRRHAMEARADLEMDY